MLESFLREHNLNYMQIAKYGLIFALSLHSVYLGYTWNIPLELRSFIDRNFYILFQANLINAVFYSSISSALIFFLIYSVDWIVPPKYYRKLFLRRLRRNLFKNQTIKRFILSVVLFPIFFMDYHYQYFLGAVIIIVSLFVLDAVVNLTFPSMLKLALPPLKSSGLAVRGIFLATKLEDNGELGRLERFALNMKLILFLRVFTFLTKIADVIRGLTAWFYIRRYYDRVDGKERRDALWGTLCVFFFFAIGLIRYDVESYNILEIKLFEGDSIHAAIFGQTDRFIYILPEGGEVTLLSLGEVLSIAK